MRKLQIPCDRHERLQMIRNAFPDAGGQNLAESWQGGRVNALQRLAQVDGLAYERNRNFLNGAVTKLSPYLRHGCINLKEAFDSVKSRFGDQAQKLLFEFAWRDYWRHVWYHYGDAIFSDMEPAKVASTREPLPDDIRSGNTNLPCMDGFIADLLADGYVHNHARMWFAAYVLHWRKVDWRAAADWYEAHLLDGDKASNHLSWQWVASTFSSKPYYFNKENLARYTGEKYCADCQAKCPFDASYEQLQAELFSGEPALAARQYSVSLPLKRAESLQQALAIYVHDEMLSPANPLVRQPSPKIFVFDPQLYSGWPLKRLQFIADCLSEMEEVEVWIGDTYEVLQQRGVGQVVTQETPNQLIRALLQPFSPKWLPEATFSEIKVSEKRLKRFSRYWEKIGPQLLGDAEYRKP